MALQRLKVRYAEPRAAIDPASRTIRVSFSLRNVSPTLWPASRSVHLGWQLFDPETDVFISEGEWTPLDGALEPGPGRPCQVEIRLPSESGRYHAYVSLVGGDEGWHYRLGRPFLLVEAAVEGGRAILAGVRPATLARMRLSRRIRNLPRFLALPARTLWVNRSLICSLVGRDISARYRGSLGDALWTVLNPLLLMATYFFVFGVVLQARFAGDPSRAGFALYFLAGLLPWLPFAEAAGRAPAVVLEHRNFVKKLVFPVEILPVNLTISGLVTQAFALGVFLLFLYVARGGVPPAALWLPVLVVPQVLFTLGLGWFLAGLGVYVRDLGQVIGYLLTLWFFLTPICYPEASLPPQAAGLMAGNPIYVLVRGFRDVLLEGRAPAWAPLGRLWILAAAAFLLGHAWFHKLRRSFADVI